MNLYKTAKMVHEQAVKSGWWEKPVDDAVAFEMIHCELSEATEEYRRGRKALYYTCDEIEVGGQPCEPRDKFDCMNFGREDQCMHRGHKPEGWAVELIDVCIRLLDWIGSKRGKNIGMAFMVAPDAEPETEKGAMEIFGIDPDMSLPELCFKTRGYLTDNYELRDDPRGSTSVAAIVCFIFGWIRAHEIDPEALLMEKHAYNGTREYRHGGKLC